MFFEYAESRGMKINFALDFDMVAAIPQKMVKTMPNTDKFMVNHKGISWMRERPGEVWLPRPDTPKGYAYYKAQAAALLELYPQIDKFVLWRRATGSVWNELKYNQIPEEWQKEYDEKITKTPKAKDLKQSLGAFAQAKLSEAYRKAFSELKREDLKIGYGTWQWSSLPAMNEFYPDFADIYILDSEVFRKDEHLHNQKMINDISKWVKPNKVFPIIWPHHDDGAYIGSPLPPFENFHTTLKQLKSDGFGVIHWMTRPFDIFFLHHAKQVMANTKNQSLEKTIDFYSERWFGKANSKVMASYMKLWVKNMPVFGCETFSNFIDKHQHKKFKNVKKVIEQCDKRLSIMNKVNIEALPEDAKANYLFFVNYEKFVKLFFEQQDLFLNLQNQLKTEGFNVSKARKIAKKLQPEKALEQYAKAIQFGQITPGEQGLLFSMGLRWIPNFLSMKQLLKEENIRLNFGTTLHESLAQLPGKDTYFIDSDKNYWKVLGGREAKRKVVDVSGNSSEYPELFKTGILINSNTKLQLAPYTSVSKKAKLLAGKYNLKLMLASKGTKSSIKVNVDGAIHEITLDEEHSIKNLSIDVTGDKNPSIAITPAKGNSIILCGLILNSIRE